MAEKGYIIEIEGLLVDRRKKPVELLNTILRFLNFSGVDIKIYNLLLKTSLTVKQIEKHLNLSERTVRKYIKKLYKEGFIVREAREEKRLKYVYTSVPIQDAWKKVRSRIQNILDNISNVLEKKCMLF